MKSIRRLFVIAFLSGRLLLVGLRLWGWVRPVLPYWRTFRQIRPTLLETWRELRSIRRNIRA